MVHFLNASIWNKLWKFVISLIHSPIAAKIAAVSTYSTQLESESRFLNIVGVFKIVLERQVWVNITHFKRSCRYYFGNIVIWNELGTIALISTIIMYQLESEVT